MPWRTLVIPSAIFSLAQLVFATGASIAWSAGDPWQTSVLWFLGAAAVEVWRQIHDHLQRSRRLTIDRVGTTSALLRAMALSFSTNSTRPSIRANLMPVVEDDKLQYRRQVEKQTAFNMKNDDDRDLNIALNAGVSGRAMLKGQPVAINVKASPIVATAGMAPEEIKKVRGDLHCILSSPVFRPGTREVVGTIQVDSHLDPHALGWMDPNAASLLGARARAFAEVAGFILAGSRN